MSTDLIHEVAEALYNLEPLVTGYGDRERKLTWAEAQMEGYGQKYINRAETVLPLILDAATARIDEAYQQMHDSLHGGRHKPDTRGQDFLDGMEHSQVAIDSLRTKP